LALAEEAARVAEQAGWPIHQMTAWYWLGSIHLLHGDVERARPLPERAVEAARTYEIWFLFDLVLVGLACARAMAGQATDALALLRDVGTQGPARSWIQPARTEAWRAETYLHAGRLEDARASANCTLAIATSRGERPNEAWARLLLGHAGVYAGGAESAEAEPHYRAALSIAGELGMRPLVAHCHLGLGKRYRRTGNREEAQEHLTTALTMYREMDMRFWLEQAEAEPEPGGLA